MKQVHALVLFISSRSATVMIIIIIIIINTFEAALMWILSESAQSTL